jgi:hypothetical protein
VCRYSGIAVQLYGGPAMLWCGGRRCGSAAALRHSGRADTCSLFNNSGREEEPRNRHPRREHAPSRLNSSEQGSMLHVGLHHGRTPSSVCITLGLLGLHLSPSEAGSSNEVWVRLSLASLTLYNGGFGSVRISKEIKCFDNKEKMSADFVIFVCSDSYIYISINISMLFTFDHLLSI